MNRIFFFVLLLLIGCASKEKTASVAETNPPPAWVNERPISSMYYTGIGLASKAPGTNFQRTAKDNALSDLASEIKVNVNTNSLLYTLEREYKFEQEFRETIRTNSDLNLEDFEIVDTWEDDRTYWVYYRMNKAQYADRLQAKKESAQNMAIDFLSKAQASYRSGEFTNSADYYLRGLQALEEFWNQENEVNYQNKTILLDNELFSGLKTLLTEVSIASEDRIELNFQNRFSSDASIRVTASNENRPLIGVPLIYSYFGEYGRVKGKLTTNADGRINIPISEVDSERKNNTLKVAIDTESFFEPFQSDAFMRKLTESLRGKEVDIPVHYKAPSIYIESVEKNLGKPLDGKPLTSAIITSLSRRDVRFANSKSEADLTLELNASTKKSGESQGFSTAMLELSITLFDNLSREKRYQVSKNNVKGVDLNFEDAGLKAYQNLTRNLESELMRKLVTDIF
ncbi:MAG: LPP20 family lipoprotein [Cryomorphaceae bacterium]